MNLSIDAEIDCCSSAYNSSLKLAHLKGLRVNKRRLYNDKRETVSPSRISRKALVPLVARYRPLLACGEERVAQVIKFNYAPHPHGAARRLSKRDVHRALTKPCARTYPGTARMCSRMQNGFKGTLLHLGTRYEAIIRFCESHACARLSTAS